MSELHENTAAMLADIRTELRGLRTDLRSEIQQLRTETTTEFRSMRTDFRSDFRWLLRLMIGGFVGTWALLAHGLHWF